MASIRQPQTQVSSKTCSVCSFKHLCLARGLDAKQIMQLDALSQNHQQLTHAQNALYWEQEEFHNIYAVRTGCLKTYTVDGEGREHIRGFHLPGDLVGLDAIYARQYPSSAVAVVPSEVCAIPYAALSRVVTDVPALQASMLEMISKDLCTSLALAGDFTADQRVAAFILQLHQRLARRNMVEGNALQLPMPRRDVAGYLRLAIETVSRVLGRFEREGWIEVSIRDLRLLDMQALWELAEPVGICHMPEATRQRDVPLRRAAQVLQTAYA